MGVQVGCAEVSSRGIVTFLRYTRVYGELGDGGQAYFMNWLYRPAVLYIMRAAWDSSC